MPNSQKTSKELSLEGRKGLTGFSSRIPILVATTTTTPKRIPITTPKPTTASTTTKTTTSTTTTEETQANDILEDEESVDSKELPLEPPVDTTTEDSTEILDKIMGKLPLEDDSRYCRETTARNLHWKFTKVGEMVIQPCPNGATGLARWRCSTESYEENPSQSVAVEWATVQPDMSDCKSVAMTNLEVKVRQEDPENVIASSLAHLTGSKTLYGGDLESAVVVMRTLANRIKYLLQQKSLRFYKKEAFIQEVLLNVIRSGSNILDERNIGAWADLHLSQQMKVTTSLLLAMEENAFLFAEVTNKQKILMESSHNILMAISVLNVKEIRNGTTFPLNNYEEPFGVLEDSIFLPLQALQHNARDSLAKTVFFSFKSLDKILTKGEQEISSGVGRMRDNSQTQRDSSKKVLNSRVISASLSRGKHIELTAESPVRISLKHLEENMKNPSCVFWDWELLVWSDSGCWAVETNKSRTVCECNHLTNFALLMEKVDTPVIDNIPTLHLEIIISVVIMVFLLLAGIILLKFRTQVHKCLLKSPCYKEEKKSLENCSKSQSFFTGINLMSTNGGEKSQTMSTTVTDSARISQYVINNNIAQGGASVPGVSSEELKGGISSQATLPMRTQPTHITLNPYSTQLVDNINRMMSNGTEAGGNHVYQVVMTPQLTKLTNTLKKKKCVGGHPGPCHHTMARPLSPHLQVVTSSSETQMEDTTETELVPESSEVVFRAVSPHGHVYWEIDPKRPDKLAREQVSDEDTNNDMHNMSDFSEDDGRVASDRSRQSSSRFSDNRPLISSTNTSPGHAAGMGMSPGLGGHMGRSPVTIGRQHALPQVSPSHVDMRFSSLRMARSPGPQTAFSTRTRLGRHHTNSRQQPPVHESLEGGGHDHNSHIPEQLQQQVQIRDLQRMPVTVKSSEYIMAKIQNHIDQQNTTRHNSRSPPFTSHKEREV